MVDISTITNSAYLGIGIFLVLLTATFIGMRLAVSIRQYKKIQVDDCTYAHVFFHLRNMNEG